MGQAIQRNNTTQPLPFLLILSSDHITGATGQTPTVTICKSGGTFAPPLGAVSEVANGWYEVAANPIDANTLGPLLLHATAAGCDPRDSEFAVVDYNPTLVLPNSPPTTATFGTWTAQKIILAAMNMLGIRQSGETMAGADMQDALDLLNGMIDGWGLQPGTILNQQREVFPLVAGQGGPANPYTMGPGGDFNTVRPVYVTGAGLLLGTSPTIEIPLSFLTDDAYEAIRIKDLGSPYPTSLYFNATQPLASIYLYPVPTSALNDLVLYSLDASLGFANLTTQYTFAPGYVEAMEYNLARRLAAPYGQPFTPELDQLARKSLAWVKTANTRMVDLSLDGALTIGSQKPWNILTGP